ncbi:MAG: MFS transporter [Candidatus Tectimicrobiota bacterium]
MEHRYPRVFVWCALANFTQAVSFALFLHFPGFLQGLGAGESSIGLLMALPALAGVVLGPSCGRLLDRHGRRPVILGGNLLNVAVIGGYLTCQTLSPALYLIRVLHGVAGTMLGSALLTYAADIVPPARVAQGLALFGVSAMLAITVGGLLGEAALAWGGYPALLLTSLLCALAGLGLTLRLAPPPPAAPPPAVPPRAWRATLCQPDLVPLWVLAWAFFIALAGVFTFLKTYVMATGLGSLGTFFTIYTCAAMVQRLALGGLPARLGLSRMLAPALLAVVLGLTLLSTARQPWMLWCAGLFCGLGHGCAYPVLLGLVSRRARVSERGTAIALYTTIDDGAILLAGPALGLLIEVAGYRYMFGSVAGGLALTALLCWRWERQRQAPEGS